MELSISKDFWKTTRRMLKAKSRNFMSKTIVTPLESLLLSNGKAHTGH